MAGGKYRRKQGGVLPVLGALVVSAVLAGGLLTFGPLALAQQDHRATDVQATSVGSGASDASDAPSDFAASSKPTTSLVAKVTLNKRNVKIKNDGTFQFKATLVPSVSGTNVKSTKVRWSISDSRIAHISQDGVVQGKKAGVVHVTAKAAGGRKATAKVKVIIQKNKMARAIPVLTYHRVASDEAKRKVYGNTNVAISASRFKAQMRWLKSGGYRTVSTSEFRDWRVNGTFLPKKSVLITFDDGLYETYHIALPILRKYDLKATSFVIGHKVPAKTSKYNPRVWYDRFMGLDVLASVARSYPNLEFQSHTYNMHYRNWQGDGIAASLSQRSIKRDFAKNAKFGFTAIAYPYGTTSYNLLAVARADKSIKIGFGYMMDYPATRYSSLYNIPRFKVFGDRGLSDFIRIVRTAR